VMQFGALCSGAFGRRAVRAPDLSPQPAPARPPARQSVAGCWPAQPTSRPGSGAAGPERSLISSLLSAFYATIRDDLQKKKFSENVFRRASSNTSDLSQFDRVCHKKASLHRQTVRQRRRNWSTCCAVRNQNRIY
jgi:hypothetical protein